MGSGCGAHHGKVVVCPFGDSDGPAHPGLHRSSETGRASVKSESSSKCSTTTTSPTSPGHEQAPGYGDIRAPGSPLKATDGSLLLVLPTEGGTTSTSCMSRHSVSSFEAGTDGSASPICDIINSPEKGASDRCFPGRLRSKEALEGCKPKGGRNSTKDRSPKVGTVMTCLGHSGPDSDGRGPDYHNLKRLSLFSSLSGSPGLGSQQGHFASEDEAVSPDEMAACLDKALKHSGSLNLIRCKVTALQVMDTLEQACQGLPKPDAKMPAFDAKIDPDNLLEHVPANPLKPVQLVLHRMSFMGTDWLAVRLRQGSGDQCLQFCSLAVTLWNIGRSSSRSVVVKACDGRSDMPCFACAPNVASSHSWLELAEDLSELAEIVLECSPRQRKRLAAELRRWAERPRKKAAAHHPPLPGQRRRSASDSGLYVAAPPPPRAIASAPLPSPRPPPARQQARRVSDPSGGTRAWLSGLAGVLEDQLSGLAHRERPEGGGWSAPVGGAAGLLRASRRQPSGAPLPPEGQPPPGQPWARRKSAPELGFTPLTGAQRPVEPGGARNLHFTASRRPEARRTSALSYCSSMLPILEQCCEDQRRSSLGSDEGESSRRRHSTGSIED